ncbi:MAG TPA: hypothetical protein VL527_14885 [Dongiaceae bacterium]|nr:hypothetical protein [Dongiaceae bacterium]
MYVLLLVTLGLNFNHPVGMVAAGLAVGALAIALFQQLMKQRWLRMLQELERRSRQYAASQNAPRALPRPETSAPLKAKEMKPAKRMAAARLAAFYRNPLKARAVLRAHPQEPDPLDRELKAIEQAAAHSAQLQVALRQRQDKRG